MGWIQLKLNNKTITETRGTAKVGKNGKSLILNKAAMRGWTRVRRIRVYTDGKKIGIVRTAKGDADAQALTHYRRKDKRGSTGAQLSLGKWAKQSKTPGGTRYIVAKGKVVGVDGLVLTRTHINGA